MKRKRLGVRPFFAMVLSLLTALVLSGCNGDDCGSCGAEVVVEVPCCEGVYPYQADILVSDVMGYRLAGAPVELYVATVPEQHYSSVTDGDGFARFYFDAPPGVTVIAYACAPYYDCNASDAVTGVESSSIFLNVVLGW